MSPFTQIRKRKLEKADILELTVKHLRNLQKIQSCELQPHSYSRPSHTDPTQIFVWFKTNLCIIQTNHCALCVSYLEMSFHCFQALLLLPSFLITILASVVAWQTSTSTCWWQTTWMEVTAVCYRSFRVSSAALWGEEKSPAPWTAA